MDTNKLNEILENPYLEKEFQEVISFVEIITDQSFSMDNLTPKNIETWNRKLDEVLKRLLV